MDNKNQDLNEMLQIRREKLENLKADGKNLYGCSRFSWTNPSCKS